MIMTWYTTFNQSQYKGSVMCFASFNFCFVFDFVPFLGEDVVRTHTNIFQQQYCLQSSTLFN